MTPENKQGSNIPQIETNKTVSLTRMLHKKIKDDDFEALSDGLKNNVREITNKVDKWVRASNLDFSKELIEAKYNLILAIESGVEIDIIRAINKFNSLYKKEEEQQKEYNTSRLKSLLGIIGKPRKPIDVHARGIYNDFQNDHLKVDMRDGKIIPMTRHEAQCFDIIDNAVRFKFAPAYYQNRTTPEMVIEKDEILDLLEMGNFEEAATKARLFTEKHFQL